MSTAFNPAAASAFVSAATAQNIAPPEVTLRRSKSTPALTDLAALAPASGLASAEAPGANTLPRRASMSDLGRLTPKAPAAPVKPTQAQAGSLVAMPSAVAATRGFNLPPELIAKVSTSLEHEDRKNLWQTSRYFRSASAEIFASDVVANRKINALMNEMVRHFTSDTLPHTVPGQDIIQGPVNKTVDVGLYVQYLTKILAKSTVANFNLSKLMSAPVSGIVQEEKRAEMVLLFCTAIAKAVKKSPHLKSLKTDMCDRVVLSSGAHILKKARRFEYVPRFIDIGYAVGHPEFMLTRGNFRGMLSPETSWSDKVKLRAPSDDDIAACFHEPRDKNFGNFGSYCISDFSMGVNAFKSISSDQIEGYENDRKVVSSIELHPSLSKVLPGTAISAYKDWMSVSRKAKHSQVLLESLARNMGFLSNATRVQITPPHDPRTLFTPTDLRISADTCLKVPKLESFVTVPVNSSEPAERDASVQYLLVRAQAHSHLVRVEVGDERYTRAKADSKIEFVKM
jgi:hypothetical protein